MADEQQDVNDPQGMFYRQAAQQGIPVGGPPQAWRQAHPELFEPTGSHPAVLGGGVMLGRPKGPWKRRHRDMPLARSQAQIKAEDPAVRPQDVWEGPDTFVVLHAATDVGSKGDVVHLSRLPEGADLERLYELGAVRPARPEERDQVQVTVVDPQDQATRTIEQATMDQREEIRQLKQQLYEAKAQAKKAQQAPPQAQAQADQPDHAVIREKDEAIEMLTAQAKEAEQRAQALEERLAQAQAGQQEEGDGGHQGRRRRT